MKSSPSSLSWLSLSQHHGLRIVNIQGIDGYRMFRTYFKIWWLVPSVFFRPWMPNHSEKGGIDLFGAHIWTTRGACIMSSCPSDDQSRVVIYPLDGNLEKCWDDDWPALTWVCPHGMYQHSSWLTWDSPPKPWSFDLVWFFLARIRHKHTP